MTKAERILTEIKTQLETITIANGFNTDAGNNVFVDRVSFDPQETKPLINIDEDTETFESISGASQIPGIKIKNNLSLNIQSIDVCDPLNPSTTGHQLIGDIKKCLFGHTWSSDIANLNYLSRSIAQHEDGSNLVSVNVEIEVLYIETLGKPEE